VPKGDAMRTREQRLLLAVLVVGGLAVLASYAHGFLTHPDYRWAIWGGIPAEMKPVYVVSMLLATAGFFPMTTFFLLRLDARNASIAGRFGYGLVLVLYAAVLVGSAAWMPLTYAMVSNPSSSLWIWIRIVLIFVGISSLTLVWALLSLQPKSNGSFYWLAVAGSAYFAFHTAVLDMLLWPLLFRIHR